MAKSRRRDWPRLSVPQSACRKRAHASEAAAIVFQQLRYPDIPFDVYQCPACHFFHVTVHGLSEARLQEFAEMIRGGDSRAECIERLSNRRTRWQIRHQIGTFVVEYCKGQKTVKVLSEAERV